MRYARAMRGADFTNVPYADLNTFVTNLLADESLLQPGKSIFDLICRHILPVTVFGSGGTDLTHKFTNLLHALRLAIGFAKHMLDKYRCSVLSITTDKGTESGQIR